MIDCDDMPTILPVKRKYRRRYGQVNKRSKVEYSSKFDNKRVENLDELAFTQIKKQVCGLLLLKIHVSSW